jgi:hypothetical protein
MTDESVLEAFKMFKFVQKTIIKGKWAVQKYSIRVDISTRDSFRDKGYRNNFFEILQLPITDLEIQILKNKSEKPSDETMEKIYEILKNKKELKFLTIRNEYNCKNFKLAHLDLSTPNQDDVERVEKVAFICCFGDSESSSWLKEWKRAKDSINIKVSK